MPTRALQDVQKEKDSRSPPVPKTRSHLQPTPPPRKSLSGSKENPISAVTEEVAGKPVKIHKKRESSQMINTHVAPVNSKHENIACRFLNNKF